MTVNSTSEHSEQPYAIDEESHAHPIFDFYTEAEEQANTITHGLGLLLSLVGLLYFLVDAQLWNHKLIFGIYGLGVVLSYMTSTLYHGAEQGWRKHRLRLADHASIYLHIAGSYTPYLVLAGASWLSTATLGMLWLVALLGAGFKLFVPDIDRFESYSVLSYLAMGWFFPLLLFDVYENLPEHTLTLLVVGGLIYTSGILFYRWESLKYNHAIWHVFVVVAGICHYGAALLLYSSV